MNLLCAVAGYCRVAECSRKKGPEQTRAADVQIFDLLIRDVIWTILNEGSGGGQCYRVELATA
jgi:hypothetical protein